MQTHTGDPILALKGIEGYLASKADHGDALARSLHEQFLKSFPQLAGAESLDQVAIEHWNSPRYGGSSVQHAGQSFSAELIDQRLASGRMMVGIGDDNGHVDAQLSVAFEVTDLPGSSAAVATLMLYDGDELAARVVRRTDGYLLMPMRNGAHLTPTCLPGGHAGWLLRG